MLFRLYEFNYNIMATSLRFSTEITRNFLKNTSPSLRFFPSSENILEETKNKKPRINKGRKPRAKVHLPLLDALEEKKNTDTKANVIEVSFTDKKKKA